MTVDVRTEIVIGRPAGVVAACAADPSNVPAWYQNITAVSWETSPPLRTGSRLAFSARFLGRQLAYTYEITDFVPGERLVMRTARGPFPVTTTPAPWRRPASSPARSPSAGVWGAGRRVRRWLSWCLTLRRAPAHACVQLAWAMVNTLPPGIV